MLPCYIDRFAIDVLNLNLSLNLKPINPGFKYNLPNYLYREILILC